MAVDWGLVLGAVSAAAVPIGFGIGVVAMATPSPGEFRFARACFIVAALYSPMFELAGRIGGK